MSTAAEIVIAGAVILTLGFISLVAHRIDRAAAMIGREIEEEDAG